MRDANTQVYLGQTCRCASSTPSICRMLLCCSHHHRTSQSNGKPLNPYTSLPCDRNTADWGANEEIFAAASDGNIARLEDLVARGAKVDAQVSTENAEVVVAVAVVIIVVGHCIIVPLCCAKLTELLCCYFGP